MVSSKKIITVSGNRKTAIARATIRAGRGRIRVNNIPLEIFEPQVGRLKIMEPLLQIGEEIRIEGPASHQEKKGTPTMGGLIIIVSIIIGVLLWADPYNIYVSRFEFLSSY